MQTKYPNHIAFIMDGNGRWATKKMLPRNLGHKAGVKALERVLKYCEKKEIKYVSLYAFSSENWKRPKNEIDSLFDLIEKYVSKDLTEFCSSNAKIVFMGDISKLPEKTISIINETVQKTKDNTGMVVNIGLNYGSRSEIVMAVNELIASGKKQITEQDLASNLYTNSLPDPDLIVRTSGEVRLSNFMLYQSAYSEMIFVDTLWPDMNAKEMDKIIKIYSQRNRRYGAITE